MSIEAPSEVDSILGWNLEDSGSCNGAVLVATRSSCASGLCCGNKSWEVEIMGGSCNGAVLLATHSSCASGLCCGNKSWE